jgi:hypothetical protein
MTETELTQFHQKIEPSALAWRLASPAPNELAAVRSQLLRELSLSSDAAPMQSWTLQQVTFQT